MIMNLMLPTSSPHNLSTGSTTISPLIYFQLHLTVHCLFSGSSYPCWHSISCCKCNPWVRKISTPQKRGACHGKLFLINYLVIVTLNRFHCELFFESAGQWVKGMLHSWNKLGIHFLGSRAFNGFILCLTVSAKYALNYFNNMFASYSIFFVADCGHCQWSIGRVPGQSKKMVVALVDMERAFIPPQHFIRLAQRRYILFNLGVQNYGDYFIYL